MQQVVLTSQSEVASNNMNLNGLTWSGETIDDQEILDSLPNSFADVLRQVNGFILYHGALHVRGACQQPAWHSLRDAMVGPKALHKLYEQVQPTDIPFAEDQFGDQLIIRDDAIFRLVAESGELEMYAPDFVEFINSLDGDSEASLNARSDLKLEPGHLFLAYPPFVFKESENGVELRALPSPQVIAFHAEVAWKLQDEV